MTYILVTKNRKRFLTNGGDYAAIDAKTAVPETFRTPALAMLSVPISELEKLEVADFDDVFHPKQAADDRPTIHCLYVDDEQLLQLKNCLYDCRDVDAIARLWHQLDTTDEDDEA